MASPGPQDPITSTLGYGAPKQGTPTPGPQGPDQIFLAHEGRGGLPRAAGPRSGHFEMWRPREGGPGQWTPNLGPQRPIRVSWPRKARKVSPRLQDPTSGNLRSGAPGKGA